MTSVFEFEGYRSLSIVPCGNSILLILSPKLSTLDCINSANSRSTTEITIKQIVGLVLGHEKNMYVAVQKLKVTCWNQSHYLEVSQGAIFIEQIMRFGLILAGTILKKK